MITHLRLIPLLLIFFALFNVGGCAQYRYVSPATEQGKQCVEKLDARVFECEQRARNATSIQRESYEFQMIGYRACTQQTPTSAQMPQPCGSEPVEPGAAQSRMCKKDYKESFIDCGGRVEEIKNN